jgi:hypothetical protein
MTNLDEQNKALDRIDWGATGRAFNQPAPLVKSPEVDPRDLETVPVEIDPGTGKATRFELRPKRVEFERDKALDRLTALYERVDKSTNAAAQARLQQEIARLEQALDSDGDGRPDGPGLGAAAAPMAAGPSWKDKLKPKP